MKNSLLAILALLAFFGCSATTEVNGGLGAYQPTGDDGFTRVFSGGYVQGISYSTDTCKTWRQPSQNTSPRVYCMASSQNNVFAATIGFGLFRSSDNGETWTHVDGIPDSNIYSVCALGSTVVIGCATIGLMTSNDEGRTWSLTDGDARAVTSLCSIGNTFFAASSNFGVLRSSDHGMTWEALTNDFGLTPSYIGVASQVLYSIVSGSAILRSTDLGDHWDNLSSFQVQYGIAGNDKMLFGGASTGMFMSSDSGATWRSIPEITSYVLRPLVRGHFIFAAAQGRGMFLSTDNGSSWRQMNQGLLDTFNYSAGVK